ncbi:YdcF family protein [Buttiauxella agrestis]|uniref:DUF218 domain-containing protein n=1 Tax=Buttiauxella agrestis ATCC 33320 TaxID=1006004 RepID=A0A085G390_9ENTR|nr:YdcF family protein [Buttiauxella agrestis]KFC78185.1 hypothetical protein GBAG_3456 [Buttiauxella agrestis ATCC 33320]
MKKRIFIALVGFLLSIACITANSIYTFSQRDETRTADCAIVLGAGVNNHVPSAVFRERLNHAIYIYQQGYVGTIILTGGISPGNTISDAEIARRYIVSQGIPDEIVLLEEKSSVTRENLSNAKQIMDSHHLYNALIISDPLHMKRAIIMAKDSNIEAFSSPTQTSQIKSTYALLRFISRESFYYTGYLVRRVFTVHKISNPA